MNLAKDDPVIPDSTGVITAAQNQANLHRSNKEGASASDKSRSTKEYLVEIPIVHDKLQGTVNGEQIISHTTQDERIEQPTNKEEKQTKINYAGDEPNWFWNR